MGVRIGVLAQRLLNKKGNAYRNNSKPSLQKFRFLGLHARDAGKNMKLGLPVVKKKRDNLYLKK